MRLQRLLNKKQATKKTLHDKIEESDRLADSLHNLEQYTRKNSLELHGIPENVCESTEELKLPLK